MMDITPSPDFLRGVEQDIRPAFSLAPDFRFDAGSPRIVIPWMRGELTLDDIMAAAFPGAGP